MEIQETKLVRFSRKQKKEFFLARFIIRARANNYDGFSMYKLALVKSDGKNLFATDGHRLHSGELEIPEGTYEVISNKSNEIVLAFVKNQRWPECDNILKKIPKKKPEDLTFSGTDFSDYALMAKRLPGDLGLQWKFFKDIHEIYPTMSINEKEKLVVFRGENATAIIMTFPL